MAISLNQTEPDGVLATYFTIQQAAVYPNSQSVSMVIYGYMNEADFLAGKSPLPEATIDPIVVPYQSTGVGVSLGITVSDPNNPPMPTIAQLYDALMQLPQFAGATLV